MNLFIPSRVSTTPDGGYEARSKTEAATTVAMRARRHEVSRKLQVHLDQRRAAPPAWVPALPRLCHLIFSGVCDIRRLSADAFLKLRSRLFPDGGSG